MFAEDLDLWSTLIFQFIFGVLYEVECYQESNVTF